MNGSDPSGPSDPLPSDEALEEEIRQSLQDGATPPSIRSRLQKARTGATPWSATMTPAELLVVRSSGLRPIATVSATCWMHYGYSWTRGHSEGWGTALRRLKDEASAAGANAVLDVKMRTLRLDVENSMDFTLIGTAVFVEDLDPSADPIVATVPALEFVRLIEGDVVPTGLAVGAHYEWLTDYAGSAVTTYSGGNNEAAGLSALWKKVRDQAHQELRRNARGQGNGVLAHVNFSQAFAVERDKQPKQYLARHIVVATTVEARRNKPFPHEIGMALDLHAGRTPLVVRSGHHNSYVSNESEGAI
jgi:uncharacterized protein YbjQ (UPF0145 family)